MRFTAAAAAGVLVLAAAFVAPADAAGEMEEVYATVVEGSGAFGMRIDSPGGPFEIQIGGDGLAGSHLGLGVWLFRGKVPAAGVAYTLTTSPDRVVVAPVTGEAGLGDFASALPEWLELDVTSHETDDACTLICATLAASNAPAGSYHLVLWVGAVESTSLVIRGAAGTGADVVVGKAHVLADAEIHGGVVNVQAQQSVPGVTPIGFKIMKDASITIPVESAVYGFWVNTNWKVVGHPWLGYFWWSHLEYRCWYYTGVKCHLAYNSWSGPDGLGESDDDRIYALWGYPPGDYDFVIDRKIDVYGGDYQDPFTGGRVRLVEGATFLTIADVGLPA